MKNTVELKHHGLFLARTPLLPLTLFQQWADAPDRQAFVREMMCQPAMSDALYLASPSLYERCQALMARVNDGTAGGRALTAAQVIEETRLYNALGKYLARAAFRCTPFGMFASITSGKIGPHTDFGALEHAGIVPRIRLDFGVQAKVIKWLMSDTGLRQKLHYRRNNSLASHGNKIYFIEGIDVARFKKYQFNQVERESYLDSLLTLAEQARSYTALRQHLIAETGADADTADTYLAQLIDNEILLPELAIRITGPDSFTVLKEQLAAMGEAGRLAELEQILAPLLAPEPPALQHNTFGPNRAPRLDEAWRQMAALKLFELERKNVFQADCSRPAPVSLSPALCQRIGQAASLLADLTRRRMSYLDDFKRRFQERYGDKAVALDLLFNDELGIPYPKPGKPISELLQGIDFPPLRNQSGSEISWGPFETLLFQKFETARAQGDLAIHFSASEIRQIAASKAELPALHGGIHVLATLFASGDTPSQAQNGSTDDHDCGIHIQSLGGRTGVELLGRFCDLDETLTQEVRAIIGRIDVDDETCVHAEIVHLPQDRIVNIVARPVLSQYEIPYLGQGGLPEAQQIPVSDLWLSLRENRFVLHSKRLQKQVIPRLTTAHNIYGNNLSLYQFLGCLTYQDQPLLGFEWPSLFQSARFLPRVTIDGATISLASWHPDKDDFAALRSALDAGASAQDGGLAALQAWRTARHMPRFVSFDVHDNVLPIDLDNPMMVQLLLDEIADIKIVRLKEALVLNAPQARPQLGQHNLEIILPLQVLRPASASGTRQEAAEKHRTRDDSTAPAAAAVQAISMPGNRHAAAAASMRQQISDPWLYIPGSQWLYFKIYCGQSQVDELLGHYLAPLMRQSLQQGQISHWFCLRYHDPEHHLRLRAHASDRASASALHLALSDACAQAMQAGFGWKIVCDSYEPEIARYGGLPALVQCEHLFHLDSEILTDFIASEAAAIPVARRWLFAVFCVDALLDAFGQSLPQKRQLADSVAASFRREFQFGARQKVQLGAKYRSYRNELDGLILGREADAASSAQRHNLLALLAPYRARMQQAAAQILALQQADQLETPLPDILASLIHMHCNRLFIANQRAHEAVFYDFLQRIYASMAATRPAPPAAGDGV